MSLTPVKFIVLWHKDNRKYFEFFFIPFECSKKHFLLSFTLREPICYCRSLASSSKYISCSISNFGVHYGYQKRTESKEGKSVTDEDIYQYQRYSNACLCCCSFVICWWSFLKLIEILEEEKLNLLQNAELNGGSVTAVSRSMIFLNLIHWGSFSGCVDWHFVNNVKSRDLRILFQICLCS